MCIRDSSNFARPGYEGKHNLIYWDCGDYLGLGPAAHSCMGGRRFYYPPDTAAFLKDVYKRQAWRKRRKL